MTVKYSLEKLINYFGIDPLSTVISGFTFENSEVNELRLDSRLVEPRDVFFALKGECYDGREFIPQAVAAGAVAIVAEAEHAIDDKTISYVAGKQRTIPQINIYQLANKLSTFADNFYHSPSEKMTVVGVTGTNGKTTVTQLIAQWITLLGEKSAVLGTLGNGLYNALTPSLNTTPSAVAIQSFLADFYRQDVKLAAIEVSSHGLALNRVKDIAFSAAIFTNLSRDHLDFHHTMENYKKVKWSLFTVEQQQSAVKKVDKKIINFDDDIGREWIDLLDDAIVVSMNPEKLLTIKALNKTYLCASHLVYHDRGVSISLQSTWGEAELESRLFGAFNVSNLLLAFAALLALGFPFYALTNTVPHLTPICGRMEIFTNKGKPTVIVDYAHTPDALDKALSAAKDHCQDKLWVIFGCGGDRDSGKRPLMAAIAEKHTDNIVITNDNPRTEDPNGIVQDIVKGFSAEHQVQVILDRAIAIQTVISQCGEQDIILIAGKGHEDYQIIGQNKRYYSDRETVRDLLGAHL